MTYKEYKDRAREESKTTVRFFTADSLMDEWMRVGKNKIRIHEDQPINTSVFEEAEVSE